MSDRDKNISYLADKKKGHLDIMETSISDESTQPASPKSEGKADDSDYLEELEKLAKLTKEGVLTKEEFKEKEKELLNNN